MLFWEEFKASFGGFGIGVGKSMIVKKSKERATTADKTEPNYHPVEVTSRQARFIAEALVSESLKYSKRGKVHKELFELWMLFDHIADIEGK